MTGSPSFVRLAAAAILVLAAAAIAWSQAPGDFTPEREAAARTFVRRHHPELDALLERLKPMNPVEYEKAVAQLFRESEQLAALQVKDRRKYDLALEAWKAGSRVRLLSAQVAGRRGAGDADLKEAVLEALSGQADVEIRQKRLERDLLAARLKKLDDQLGRLESDRDRKVAARYQALLKKGAAGKAVPKAPPTNVPATPTPPLSKGDRR